MIGIFIEDKKKYSNYIFKTFFDILGYPYEIKNSLNFKFNHDILLYYGEKDVAKYIKKFKGPVVKIPFNKQKNLTKSRGIYNKKRNSFNSDIILESFEIISRKEEYNGKKDAHQRFTAENSAIYKNLENPLVSRYIKIIDEIVKDAYKKQRMPLIKKTLWPDNKNFAVCLSHDVDTPYKHNFIGTLVLIKNSLKTLLNLKLACFAKQLAGIFFGITGREDSYWQFYNIMNIERKYGFKSTFFFCTGKKHKLDPNYSVSDTKIRKIMNEIEDKCWEVGLHLSYNAYKDKNLMLKEKVILEKVLGNKISGTRTHFLRFKIPDTWHSENNIFEYDTSLGYPTCIGYRNGLCYPYRPFDIIKNEEFNVIEIPLTIMDAALFNNCAKLPVNCWSNLLEFYKTIKDMNGILTLDWHQRFFFEKDFSELATIYKKSLGYFKRENAYAGSCREITRWWAKRNKVNFIKTKQEGKKTTWVISSGDFIKDLCFSISIPYRKYEVNVLQNKAFGVIKTKKGLILKFKKIMPNQKTTIIVSH
jgi:peptidoglycan/xylan/chitin deacetylase (PgdA/CDA1 family)